MIYQGSRFLFVVTMLLLATTVFGQKQMDAQAHAWAMYFGNHRINDRWGIHTEYQWRRDDMFARWQQSLMRVGVEYYLKNGVQFALGYGWIRTYPYGSQPVAFTFDEHRLWQQVMMNQQVWRISVNHRYRMEQRWVETQTTDVQGSAFIDYQLRHRGRYRLLLTVPLSRSTLADNTLFLGLYDEVFLGFGPHIGKNVLDQNRAFAALGWRFNKNFNVQAGYLNQYVIKTDGIHAERNHTLQLSVQYNIDLRKQ
ncbi:MAG: DUF2490 domain-containing protein [Flavobacteriales bacterium]|nr:DUF2490 domain-containing protein [Flavobacteriales bacterium]